ncbi:hypothetical protein GOC13_07280 [Sinorhizobium meliloti]|nr:hypothetical protein [Sinorhizobium meliloti]
MKKIKVAAAVAAVVLLASCGVNPSKATRALEAQGMTAVQIEGYALLGCGREDFWRSNFTAVGTNGQAVTGTVCQGLFKGTTVRFD